MWIKSLHIDRAYGRDFDLALQDLCPDMNVLCAPNGAGKSTLCATIRELLFSSQRRDIRAKAEVVVGDKVDSWTLISGEVYWESGTVTLASSDLAACYTLTIDELGRAQGTDESIKRAIERELSGGFDVSHAIVTTQPKRARASTRLVDAVKSARTQLDDATAAISDLRMLEQRASELESVRRVGDKAAAVLARISDCEKLNEKRAELEVVDAQLRNMPEMCARLQTGDDQNLRDWEQQERQACERQSRAQEQHAKWNSEIANSDRHAAALTSDSLNRAKRDLGDARTAYQAMESAEKTAHEARARFEAECQRIGWSLDPDQDAVLDHAMVRELSALLEESGEVVIPRGVFVGGRWLVALAASIVLSVIVGVLLSSIPYGVIAGLAGLLGGFIWLQYQVNRGEDASDPESLNRVRDSLKAHGLKDAEKLDSFHIAHLLQGLDRLAGDLTEYRAQNAIARDAGLKQASALAQLQESCGIEAEDVRKAADDLEELERRNRAYKEAEEQRNRSAEDLSDAEARIAIARERISNLCERAGVTVDDIDSVKEGLRVLSDWQVLANKRVEIKGAVEGMEAAIRAEDEGLLDFDTEGLIQLEEEKLSEKEAAENAARELGVLEDRLRKARSSTDVANAEAEFVGASDDLKSARSSHIVSVLSTFLLERAREACATSAIENGAISRRMSELFHRSTHGRYEVRGVRAADQSESLSFAVRDTSDAISEVKELTSLSTGARAQLLLCARIAFLESQEQSGPMPIVLDDALGHSDPERFDATMDLLLELVREGRQVIYLTDEPLHASRWVEAAQERSLGCSELHIGAARRHAHIEHVDDSMKVLPSPQSGETVSSYAERVGAPVPEKWYSAESLHIVFVLFDDLEMAFRLMQERVNTLGQASRFVQGEAAKSWSSEELNYLVERIELVRAVVDLAAIGFGRPWNEVDMDEAGELVTKTMREKFRSFAHEHGFDGARLIEAARLNQDGLKNIQKKRMAELEDHFLSRGVIAREERLSLDDIVREVRGRLPLREHSADAVEAFARVYTQVTDSSAARISSSDVS